MHTGKHENTGCGAGVERPAPDSRARTRERWHDARVRAEPVVAGQDRVNATARAVIECAADAIVAFSAEGTVLLWNPAAERMFGWGAGEVVGEEPPLIPEELQAEHNAALERDRSAEAIGWVNVCHRTGEDTAARHHMAERAQVVRKLGDVIADMNAQRDLG